MTPAAEAEGRKAAARLAGQRYEARHREKRRARSRNDMRERYQRLSAEQRSEATGRRVLRRYGLTPAAFAELIRMQGGACAICRVGLAGPRRPHIDHDHDSGRVRGVLCERCNPGLGALHETRTLARAVSYLQAGASAARVAMATACDSLPGSNSERARDRQLRRRYGITFGQMGSLLRAQHDCCAICERPFDDKEYKPRNVDHDHRTGEVRGILCGHCNRGLGLFRDDGVLLRAAIAYLAGAS